MTLFVCSAGLVVQLLAVSVDHQRFYLERSFEPFFWIDESAMYKTSALLARPAELVAVLERRDVDRARALVPGPNPASMTSVIFGPPVQTLPQAPEWMRHYLVFLVPRPWVFWSRLLPEVQRPGSTGMMAGIGIIVALGSFAALAVSTHWRSKTNR
jgi:hypothetical protein